MTQILRTRRYRRNAAMQQLSFLEPPPQENVVPVWHSLDEEQRARLLARLARLIVNVIAHTPGEHDDERTEQDHR